MTCVHMKFPGRYGHVLVNIANPSERVTMANGKVLELEWHNYCGPGVVMKNGCVRGLSGREFRDPAVDAWITKQSEGSGT